MPPSPSSPSTETSLPAPNSKPSPLSSSSTRDSSAAKVTEATTATFPALQTAVRNSGISKKVACHTLRLSGATHLLETGYDIRTIQELLEHTIFSTSMNFTHVSFHGAVGIRGPLDRL
ncbi:MAG: tyrosine-type recombinase/integrase [Planctomycetota bacterium]